MLGRLGLAALLLLAACTGIEPFDPPTAGELEPGPGLFSGPTGEFVILRPEGDAEQLLENAPGKAQESPADARSLTRPPPP